MIESASLPIRLCGQKRGGIKDSLDDTKHTISAVLTDCAVEECRAGSVLVVDGSESLSSIDCTSVPAKPCSRTIEGRLTFPRIESPSFHGLVTDVGLVGQSSRVLLVSFVLMWGQRAYRSTSPNVFKSITLFGLDSEGHYVSAIRSESSYIDERDIPNLKTP